MYDLITALGSGIALFLVGANIAFMANLGTRIVVWFRFKVAALTLLLTYVSFSMWVGQPAPWRLGIGMVALILDIFALFWMWHSIESMRQQGVKGLVPLVMDDDD